MNFDEARPEYYEGLKVFQARTNQQDQLKLLLGAFLNNLICILRDATSSDQMNTSLSSYFEKLTKTPLVWRDVGSGDGSFTKKVFEVMREAGIPLPDYEGIDPDGYFVDISRQALSDNPRATIVQTYGFDGNLHARGLCDILSGFNSLYFVRNFPQLKSDIDNSLNAEGMALFIQNTFFTGKAGEAFIGDSYKDFVATIPTEVFFPKISEEAFNMITSRATAEDIQNSDSLSDLEKSNALITKQIIDSMGGISTETEAGQKVAFSYKERITGQDYGGVGKYISDNMLLVYPSPNMPLPLRAVIKEAMDRTRKEISANKGLTFQHSSPAPKSPMAILAL